MEGWFQVNLGSTQWTVKSRYENLTESGINDLVW